MTRARRRSVTFAVLTGALLTTAFLVGPTAAFAYPTEVFTVPKSLALAVFTLGAGILVALSSARGTASSRNAVASPAVSADLSWATWGATAMYFALGVVSWALRRGAGWSLFDWMAHDGAAAVLFVAARSRAARASTPRLAALMVWVASALALVAILEALGVPLAWSQIRRPVSLLGNRNVLGAYVAVAIPFALAFAVARASPLRLLAVVLLFTVVTITRCRSAWLGLFVAAVAGVAFARRRRERRRPFRANVAWTAAAALAGLAIAVVSPWTGLRWSELHPLASTAERIAAYGSGSGLVRVSQARLAFAMATAHPLGVGPGGWDDAESEFAPRLGGSLHEWQVADTPSSEATRALAEVGFPGLAAALVVGGLVTATGIRRARRGGGASWQPILVAAWIVALVHAGLDAPLSRPPTIALFAVLAGLVSAPEAARDARPSPPAGAWAMAVGSILFAVMSVVAPVALFVAATRSRLDASPWQKAAAQRIYPRLYLAEYLTQRFGALGFCADAAEEAERLVARVPHHLGPYHAVLHCMERKGDAPGAAVWRARLAAVSPDEPMDLP